MAILTFLRWKPPPYPPSLMAYLTPPPYPHFFFQQNNRKGYTLDYLDGLGHFLFGFGVTGTKSRGGGNHPLLGG